jgi:hypothetical protein
MEWNDQRLGGDDSVRGGVLVGALGLQRAQDHQKPFPNVIERYCAS